MAGLVAARDGARRAARRRDDRGRRARACAASDLRALAGGAARGPARGAGGRACAGWWTGPARHGAAGATFRGAPEPFFNVNTPERPRARRGDAGGARAVRIYGVTGWKNSGKTTLVERLVTEIIAPRLQRLDAEARASRLRRRPARQGQPSPPAGRGAPGAGRLGRALGADDRAARRAGAAARRRCSRSSRPSTWCWSRATSATATRRSRSAAPRRRQDLIAAGDATIEAIASDAPLPGVGRAGLRSRRRSGRRRLHPAPGGARVSRAAASRAPAGRLAPLRPFGATRR